MKYTELSDELAGTGVFFVAIHVSLVFMAALQKNGRIDGVYCVTHSQWLKPLSTR